MWSSFSLLVALRGAVLDQQGVLAGIEVWGKSSEWERGRKISRGSTVWDPQGMGGSQARLPKVLCCRAGDEMEDCIWGRRGEREGLRAVYFFFGRGGLWVSSYACGSWELQ